MRNITASNRDTSPNKAIETDAQKDARGLCLGVGLQ
jgi:hypothetical protein